MSKTAEKRWLSQRRRYRAFVQALSPEDFENERYTVEHEWKYAADEYARRYPDLEHDDLLAILGR